MSVYDWTRATRRRYTTCYLSSRSHLALNEEANLVLARRKTAAAAAAEVAALSLARVAAVVVASVPLHRLLQRASFRPSPTTSGNSRECRAKQSPLSTEATQPIAARRADGPCPSNAVVKSNSIIEIGERRPDSAPTARDGSCNRHATTSPATKPSVSSPPIAIRTSAVQNGNRMLTINYSDHRRPPHPSMNLSSVPKINSSRRPIHTDKPAAVAQSRFTAHTDRIRDQREQNCPPCQLSRPRTRHPRPPLAPYQGGHKTRRRGKHDGNTNASPNCAAFRRNRRADRTARRPKALS